MGGHRNKGKDARRDLAALGFYDEDGVVIRNTRKRLAIRMKVQED